MVLCVNVTKRVKNMHSVDIDMITRLKAEGKKEEVRKLLRVVRKEIKEEKEKALREYNRLIALEKEFLRKAMAKNLLCRTFNCNRKTMPGKRTCEICLKKKREIRKKGQNKDDNRRDGRTV